MHVADGKQGNCGHRCTFFGAPCRSSGRSIRVRDEPCDVKHHQMDCWLAEERTALAKECSDELANFMSVPTQIPRMSKGSTLLAKAVVDAEASSVSAPNHEIVGQAVDSSMLPGR